MSIKAADNEGYRISWPADRKITLTMQTKDKRANETDNRPDQTGKLHNVSYTNMDENCSNLKTIGSLAVADCTDNADLVILRNA